MQIAGYEVTEITKVSAKVGCTTVSRSEVSALANAMDKAGVGYKIQHDSLSNSNNWIDCSSPYMRGAFSIDDAAVRVRESASAFPNHKFRIVPA